MVVGRAVRDELTVGARDVRRERVAVANGVAFAAFESVTETSASPRPATLSTSTQLPSFSRAVAAKLTPSALGSTPSTHERAVTTWVASMSVTLQLRKIVPSAFAIPRRPTPPVGVLAVTASSFEVVVAATYCEGVDAHATSDNGQRNMMTSSCSGRATRLRKNLKRDSLGKGGSSAAGATMIWLAGATTCGPRAAIVTGRFQAAFQM